MITAADLAQVPLFSAVEGSERLRLARKTADIRLSPGEWATREGEERRFFVVLEGTLKSLKDIVGQSHLLGQSQTGTFFGETPIFVGTATLVSSRELTPCRLARFERQQLQELVRDSPAAGEMIFQLMSSRLSSAQQVARQTSSSRVQIIGPRYDLNGRAIRSFLSANRIQFDWAPHPQRLEELTVTVDGREPLTNPTVRQIAEALGLNTVPKHNRYDVIIAGAVPAGMAAAVYGASEGLNVLVVERSSPGQAGTPSRIETTSASPPRSPATTSPNAASAKAAWPSPSSTSTSPSEHP